MRRIDYLYANPEILANLLVGVSMDRDRFAFHSPAGSFDTFTAALEKTQAWLMEPHVEDNNE